MLVGWIVEIWKREASFRVGQPIAGKTCTVRIGQTVLEATEEQGVPIPSSCRQGQCGTCKTKLLEGNVRMDVEEGSIRSLGRKDLC